MYFKVGQKVSHQSFGNGVIIDITPNDDYSLKVEFEEYDDTWFTIDGKESVGDPHPSLSQEPHAPLVYKEICEFEDGEWVWCKDNFDVNWSLRKFAYKKNNTYYCYKFQNFNGDCSLIGTPTDVVQFDEVKKFNQNPPI